MTGSTPTGINANGAAEFTTVNGASVILTSDTEPDINVRERLVAARETFENLKAAVNGAADFAALKSALLTALADYEPSASTMPAPEPKKTTRKRKS